MLPRLAVMWAATLLLGPQVAASEVPLTASEAFLVFSHGHTNPQDTLPLARWYAPGPVDGRGGPAFHLNDTNAIDYTTVLEFGADPTDVGRLAPAPAVAYEEVAIWVQTLSDDELKELRSNPDAYCTHHFCGALEQDEVRTIVRDEQQDRRSDQTLLWMIIGILLTILPWATIILGKLRRHWQESRVVPVIPLRYAPSKSRARKADAL